MIFFVAVLTTLFYLLIGVLLSALWVQDGIKNAGKKFDSLSYIFRCAFMWPNLIFNKGKR